jgi:hypothetical protein
MSSGAHDSAKALVNITTPPCWHKRDARSAKVAFIEPILMIAPLVCSSAPRKDMHTSAVPWH